MPVVRRRAFYAQTSLLSRSQQQQLHSFAQLRETDVEAAKRQLDQLKADYGEADHLVQAATAYLNEVDD